ncbi:Ankyrin repeat domain-containing protein [Rhodovastum atsumiense]|uniref:Ankyrin repeat domain-containing protein n=1 Tax=Rhodovastum atsumiense TaxID=504468 RepID=A0A5M6IYZ4_9PROT|nr:ankyrin repeat domain-containing protein [Rhodovastum atsumiense]KAA5613047.1 ankyrin repeat domain-containing protein [Rhodovastum atsumiense]CAH2600095.1 Ankyrin repeat domain-containing protein [Rhodovastum atsumiense]
MRHPFALSPAILLGAGLLAAPAWAQMSAPGTTNGVLTGPVVNTPQSSQGSKRLPPPALPGARTVNADPAPAERPALDMAPNEALFDAVNRGDIASARDAVARGADPHARNVLGLTPLELSVDLGRNDITFLLLSLRGAGGGSAPPPEAKSAHAEPRHAAPRPEQRHAAARPVPVATAAPKPPPRVQYADTPGTPVPAAGFLGFGGVTR